MKRLQAFKFELIPNGEQRQSMSQFAGSRRFVYNKALKLQAANYAAGNKYIRYESFAKYIGVWRTDADYLWLGDAPYHTLQQSLKDLDKAFKNFFAKRTEYPTRKKRGVATASAIPIQSK